MLKKILLTSIMMSAAAGGSGNASSPNPATSYDLTTNNIREGTLCHLRAMKPKIHAAVVRQLIKGYRHDKCPESETNPPTTDIRDVCTLKWHEINASLLHIHGTGVWATEPKG